MSDVNPDRPDALAADCGSSTHRPVAKNELRRITDTWTSVVLVIAALVSGSLSAWGAHALFPGNSWVLPIAFAIVVQIIATVALWLLPFTGPLKRILMMTAWVITFMFSVGSSFFASYQGIAADAVAETKDDVGRWMFELKKRTQAIKGAAALAADRAKDEQHRGTYSGLIGYGPQARRLRSEAVVAASEANEAVRAEAIVDASLEKLKLQSMSIEDVRNLFNDTRAGVGSYADGVPEPDFRADRRSFVAIVFSAYVIAVGQDPSATKEERRRVLGALGAASIMEILALLSALIRVGVHGDTEERSVSAIAKTIELVLTVIEIPQQVRERMHSSHARMKQDAIDRAQPVWFNAIAAYTASVKPSEVREAIEDLLPGCRGMQRRIGNRPGNDVAVLFDGKVFERSSVIAQAALVTSVVVRCSDGRLAAGPLWEPWIRYLISLLSNPPRSSGRSSSGRPNLRIVRGR